MARASSICIYGGCYEYAIKDGRCAEHKLKHTWESSTHVNDPGWDKRRRYVLKRDKHRCRICGKRANVVDHIQAQAFGGPAYSKNLQALCAKCHNIKTQDEARLGKLLRGKSADERASLIGELAERWRP